jgi:hypothetical protein
MISVTDPYGRILEAEWTAFQIHYFSENMTVLGIEPRPLITRPQRQSKI